LLLCEQVDSLMGKMLQVGGDDWCPVIEAMHSQGMQ
jgi:hypothetical protein